MTKWQYAIAALNTVGFFGILAVMMLTDIKIAAEYEKAFGLLIGALISQYTIVVGYFFGSSKGSSDKNATIYKAMGKDKP